MITSMTFKCMRPEVRERSERKTSMYCVECKRLAGFFFVLFAKEKVCFATLHFKNAHAKITLGDKRIWIRNITVSFNFTPVVFTHSEIPICLTLPSGNQKIVPFAYNLQAQGWLTAESIFFSLMLTGLIDLSWNIKHGKTKKSTPRRKWEPVSVNTGLQSGEERIKKIGAILQERSCVLFEAETDFKGIERAQHETPRSGEHGIHLSTCKTQKPTVWVPVSPGS